MTTSSSQLVLLPVFSELAEQYQSETAPRKRPAQAEAGNPVKRAKVAKTNNPSNNADVELTEVAVNNPNSSYNDGSDNDDSDPDNNIVIESIKVELVSSSDYSDSDDSDSQAAEVLALDDPDDGTLPQPSSHIIWTAQNVAWPNLGSVWLAEATLVTKSSAYLSDGDMVG
ncbi:hypothetical protein IQ07DRAFT_594483 [Pyrenochaeta sp. DS3sAY3a]|nr:hypothetical protein IQ07DRAFT_594483 [Pyrenochaeta sp. DS3sAY3a]